jgi:hypothetical protein
MKWWTRLRFSPPVSSLRTITASPEELEHVIDEMAQRFVDVIIATAPDKIRAVLAPRYPDNQFLTFETGDSIVVHYSINFCVGDIIQIISRLRREKP